MLAPDFQWSSVPLQKTYRPTIHVINIISTFPFVLRLTISFSWHMKNMSLDMIIVANKKWYIFNRNSNG